MLIHYSDDYIYGFEMFDKDGSLLCDQTFAKNTQKMMEILFNPGEKLIGVKSKWY